mmetsp:Transcript_9672/g.15646  ORF Transcript_9672/g.15646 Transcript_9672/m.15646 type:complete len:86 (-) Transcript_9672:97-354(-)
MPRYEDCQHSRDYEKEKWRKEAGDCVACAYRCAVAVPEPRAPQAIHFRAALRKATEGHRGLYEDDQMQQQQQPAFSSARGSKDSI